MKAKMSGKKGELSVVILGIVGFLLFFVAIAFGEIDRGTLVAAKDVACEGAGGNIDYLLNQEVCIFSGGRAHFVTFDCTGWLWNMECTMTVIDLGNFRIK